MKSLWLRHPRTTQERRRWHDRNERPYIRLKRTSRRLPNAYDDIWIHTRKNVSWKRLRRTQYKTK